LRRARGADAQACDLGPVARAGDDATPPIIALGGETVPRTTSLLLTQSIEERPDLFSQRRQAVLARQSICLFGQGPRRSGPAHR